LGDWIRDKNLDGSMFSYRVIVDHDGPSVDDHQQYFKDQYAFLPTKGVMVASDELCHAPFNRNVDGRASKTTMLLFFMNLPTGTAPHRNLNGLHQSQLSTPIPR
jgi:hypothetical protein